MEKYHGIVFDFNGTLLWDTKLHNSAWDEFLKKHHIELSDSEKHEHLHGKTNRDILEFVFGRKLGSDEVDAHTEEKEAAYRQLCLDAKLQLADGAIELLDYCTENRVPIAIATSSSKVNVDFFVEQFDLRRWFPAQRILFNDGTIKSKPDPELFTKAMAQLGLPADTVIIFEDSISGIKAAENAGVGKVIIVNSNDEKYRGASHDIITSFREFAIHLLEA